MSEAIISRIDRIPWFAKLGESSDKSNVEVESLDYWRSSDSTSGNRELDGVLSSMKWLPSSRDEVDPFVKTSVTADRVAAGMAAYRIVLKALRNFDSPLLKVGPHDFNEAAKQAAAYAARAVARNYDRASSWERVLCVYEAGHWPLGFLPDGRLVVF